MNQTHSLHRLRWGLRATLALGVAASVAANVLHARPNLVSQVIAGWSPLALLLTVEWITRVPVHHKGLSFARIAATAVIAGIAAWVSYWHMVDVTIRYGESGSVPYLLPFSVDGLVVVASISLVELSARLRVTDTTEPATGDGVALVRTDPPPAAPRPAVVYPQPGQTPTDEPASRPSTAVVPVAAEAFTRHNGVDRTGAPR